MKTKERRLTDSELIDGFVRMATNPERFPQFEELCKLIHSALDEIKEKDKAEKAKADAPGSQPEAAEESKYYLTRSEFVELKAAAQRVEALGDFLERLDINVFQLRGVERFPIEMGIMIRAESGYMGSILEDVEKDAAKA